jgi:hypothetical protein
VCVISYFKALPVFYIKLYAQSYSSNKFIFLKSLSYFTCHRFLDVVLYTKIDVQLSRETLDLDGNGEVSRIRGSCCAVTHGMYLSNVSEILTKMTDKWYLMHKSLLMPCEIQRQYTPRPYQLDASRKYLDIFCTNSIT